MFKYTLLEQKVDILMLQEIIKRDEVFKNLVNKIFPYAKLFFNDIEGSSRGLTTLWNLASIFGTLVHTLINNLALTLHNFKSNQSSNLINVYVLNAQSLELIYVTCWLP